MKSLFAVAMLTLAHMAACSGQNRPDPHPVLGVHYALKHPGDSEAASRISSELSCQPCGEFTLTVDEAEPLLYLFNPRPDFVIESKEIASARVIESPSLLNPDTTTFALTINVTGGARDRLAEWERRYTDPGTMLRGEKVHTIAGKAVGLDLYVLWEPSATPIGDFQTREEAELVARALGVEPEFVSVSQYLELSDRYKEAGRRSFERYLKERERNR